MFTRLTITALLATTSWLPQAHAAEEGNDTTVALTAAVYSAAGKPERDLAGALLALLELEVSSQDGLAVVERRQIDLALHELALTKDLSRNATAKLRLGKIASADFILTMELLQPAKEDDKQRVLIRIVESLTGVVRGVSFAQVEESRLDEAGTAIAQYLAIVEAAPERPPITVAVAPFESKGRFDRLRPLELGLRDMFATRLRRWSDTIASEQAKAAADGNAANADARGFQVLQRSSMQELLSELDLIQSGLSDVSRLPKTLPTRAAAFLVRGEIDERNDDGEFRIVVSGELVHAASNRAVRDFEFEATPDELEVQLAHQVDLFAGRLISSTDEVSETPGSLRELNEVDSLFGRVASDLKRFQRIRPVDFSYRRFELPGRFRLSGPLIVRPDTPLGLALLKKSIDRLESTLFIQPDRADAAFALGFCYSFHYEGIWNPDRADELLRRAAGSDPDGELGAAALRLLAEVSFHNQKGRVPDSERQRAVEQEFHAFRNIPKKYRDKVWARLPAHIARNLPRLRKPELLMQVMELAAKEAECEDSPYRYELAMGVRALSSGLGSADHASGLSAMPLLKRWVEGDQPMLRQVASRGLATMSMQTRDYVGAANWCLVGADGLADSDVAKDRYARDNLRVNAANYLRQGGKVREALVLLESFKPTQSGSLNDGRHAVELGLCYMHNKQNDKALEVFVAAGERVRSLASNSPLKQYIEELGGVPLRDDRDVDVTYLKGPNGASVNGGVLATDGTSLFRSGVYRDGATRGVLAFDPRRESWRSLTEAFTGATSLTVSQGTLWVGTAKEGVWRCNLASNDWKQWTTEQGLPDDRVMAVATHEDGAFVSLGTAAAGGVAFIDADGEVTVLDGKDAPKAGPAHLVLQGEQLLAATRSSVYEFDLGEKTWTQVPNTSGRHVFAGESHAWVSKYSREIAPYGADDKAAERFKAAWFDEAGAAGYTVRFVIEHKDQIWFGGFPWARFRSVGFYRVDPRTGEFHMYGLRDGFKMSTTFVTYSGVAIGNDLFLLTSAGLARVTPR